MLSRWSKAAAVRSAVGRLPTSAVLLAERNWFSRQVLFQNARWVVGAKNGHDSAQTDWRSRYIECLADLENERKGFSRRLDIKQRDFANTTSKQIFRLLDYCSQVGENSDSEDVRNHLSYLNHELLKVLASMDVKPFDTKPGDKFDPKYHEALKCLSPRSIGQSGRSPIIHEVICSGFIMESNNHSDGPNVLRPAKVITG